MGFQFVLKIGDAYTVPCAAVVPVILFQGIEW